MAAEKDQRDFVRELIALDVEDLRHYLVNRLSGQGPFEPPLREPDESPRHFVENLLQHGMKVNPEFFQRIESIIQSVLESFLRGGLGSIKGGVKEDVVLLSHCLYLAGEFRLQSCASVLWRQYMSGITPYQIGPLGNIRTLVTDAFGILNPMAPEEAEAFWRMMCITRKDPRERITAFVNLYMVNPLGAHETAESLLKDWKERDIDATLDIAGILTRYLWHLHTLKGAGQQSTFPHLVHSFVRLAYWTLPQPKCEALFKEMQRFGELAPYVIPYVKKKPRITVFGVDSEPARMREELSKLAENPDWTVGAVSKDLSDSLFTGAEDVAVCVINRFGASDNGRQNLAEIASFVYSGINKKDVLLMFLLEERLWRQLRTLVEQPTNGGVGVSPLTSLQTSRVTSFTDVSDSSLRESVVRSVDCGLAVHECLTDGNGIAEGVLKTAKTKGAWPGDVLFRMVAPLFNPLVGSDPTNLRQDCFTAVVHSLADRESGLFYEPTMGLWGRRLDTVKICPKHHPWNLGSPQAAI